MGYGAYSLEAHRATTEARAHLPQEAVFSRRHCDPSMNPFGVRFRESRDSAEHPNSVGVVFALDVTGDEVPFAHVSPAVAARVIGRSPPSPIPIHEITAELQKRFHVFFLIPDAERTAFYERGAVWRKLLHERAIVLGHPEDTALVCALLIAVEEGRIRGRDEAAKHLEARLGTTGELRNGILGAIGAFMGARAKKPIDAPPGMLGARQHAPAVQR